VSKDDNVFRLWWTNGIDPYYGSLTAGRPQFYQGSAANVSTTVLHHPPMPDASTAIMGVVKTGTTTNLLLGRNIWVYQASTTASALKAGGLSSLGGYLWKGHVHEVLANQTASLSDWTNLCAYWESKYGLANKRICMMDGDSITAGSGASSASLAWAKLVTTDLGSSWDVFNQAGSGQTIGDRTAGGGPSEWMSKTASSTEFIVGNRSDGVQNVLVAWGGTNDLFYGATAAAAYSSYVSYCQAAQAAGYYVIAVTMLDRNPSGGSWTRAAMLDFNTSVRADWATFADTLIDPVTLDSRFDDDASAFFADGVHPSDAGHAALASYFLPAIRSA